LPLQVTETEADVVLDAVPPESDQLHPLAAGVQLDAEAVKLSAWPVVPELGPAIAMVGELCTTEPTASVGCT
jgi:hypothetical protein